jgi:hypothetical protein
MTVGGTLCESFPSAKPKASIAVVVTTRQVLTASHPQEERTARACACRRARPGHIEGIHVQSSNFKLQTGARTVARQKQVALSESSNQTSELMPDGVN